MANHISMGDREAIIKLFAKGWHKRRIARELGLDRKTVRRHIRECAELSSQERERGGKSPIMPAGEGSSKSPIMLAGDGPSKGTIMPAGKSAGRPSRCEPFHTIIAAGVADDLSGQRIFQDLRSEHGFTAAYDSVKRYLRRHFPDAPRRVWRVECGPGEEVQVDFGAGAPLVDEDGRRRRTHVFRMVLSYSRKAYSEAVLRQDTETFIRCLENAFRHFGGVTRTVVLDNLKAAVQNADWYDPELNPKIIEFGRHYGTVFLPNRPRQPEHNGKVESSVKYVKSNALKGREFPSLQEENRFLRDWEASIADHRIHGTTRQQVSRRFATEKPMLQPLPAMLFPCFEEARRLVHRDSFVEIAKAYYEAPPEYIGCNIWVRWDSHLVRLFNARMESIGVLARKRPGEFSRCLGARGRSTTIERSVDYWLNRVGKMGEYCRLWADALFAARGEWAIRVLQGLAALSRDYPARSINEACRQAMTLNLFRLRSIRELLKRPMEQRQLEFMSAHPLIRDPSEYGTIAPFAPEPDCGAPVGCEFYGSPPPDAVPAQALTATPTIMEKGEIAP